MRASHLPAAVALAMASHGLHAQDSPSLDGTWRFTVLPPNIKVAHMGEVVLSGHTGTWKIFARNNIQLFNYPCVGRPFPLTVLPNEPGNVLTFKVHESDTVASCPDMKIMMHAVTAKRLEGSTALGYPVTMERD